MIGVKQILLWGMSLVHLIGGPYVLYLAYSKQIKMFYFTGSWLIVFGIFMFIMGIMIGRAERRLKESRARLDASRESFMRTVEEYRSQSIQR